MQTADKLYSLDEGEDSPTALPVVVLGEAAARETAVRFKAEPEADPNDVIEAAGCDPAAFTAEVGTVAGRDCWAVRRRS
jgi:hypothetical protein